MGKRRKLKKSKNGPTPTAAPAVQKKELKAQSRKKRKNNINLDNIKSLPDGPASSAATPAPQKKLKTNINVDRLKTLLKQEETVKVQTKKEPQDQPQLPKPKAKNKNLSLAETAKQQLESSHFRFLNQQLYTMNSSEAWSIFQDDPQSFFTYHKGFANQVEKWPVNPLDLIIKDLKKQSKELVVADFGCGEARLSQSVANTVHSFDLVAANERVQACDMADVPLADRSVDVAVFCLALMGTNINDFLLEANRVLKMGGVLHVAEVESRCPDVKAFFKSVQKLGFQLQHHDERHGYFFLAKFTKSQHLTKKNGRGLPLLQLKPCLYKKR